jgi:hypothetical protein
MWTYLPTSSFINPLAGYVETKVALSKVLRPDEITLVLVRLDHIAAFVRSTDAARHVPVWRGWDRLRNAGGIKKSPFHAASRAREDLCVANAKTPPVAKAISGDPGTGYCA